MLMNAYAKKHLKPIIFIIIGIMVLTAVILLILANEKPKETTAKRTQANIKEEPVEKFRPPFQGRLGHAGPAPPGFLESLMITLAEAQKRVPVKIALPSYLPEGTTLKGVFINP